MLLLCSVMPMFALWQTPVVHFTRKNYGAGTQNWGIAIASNNWSYVANNYGLLEYDGDRWHLYGMPNSTAVRSLMIGLDGRIYVGATNEFGIFAANAVGGLDYHSLSDSLDRKYAGFGEVWNIHGDAEGGETYFQTDNYLIRRTDDGTLSCLCPGSHIYCSATIRGGVYVATAEGVFLLVGEQFNLLNNSQILAGKQVRKLIPWSTNQILIATFDDGLYVYDGQTTRKFDFAGNDFLRKNKLYCMAVDGSRLALGTVRGGLMLVGLKDGSVQIFDMQNSGLQNNTVLSVAFDNFGNLDVGLDNGIDRLLLQSPYRNFSVRGIPFGSGYAAMITDKAGYMGTNQGLFVNSFGNRDMNAPVSFIEASAGQVWGLDSVGGVILCSHHKGLFQVSGTKFIPLSTADGFWHVCKLDDNYLVAGSYTGFYLLQKQKNTVRMLHKIKGYEHTAMNFEVDGSGQIWAVSPEGVARLRLNDKRDSLASETVYEFKYPQDYVKIFALRDRLVISGEYFCRVVGADGVLREDKAFFDLLDGEHFYRLIRQNADYDLWFLRDEILSVRKCVDVVQHTYEPAARTMVMDDIQFVVGFEHLNFASQDLAVIGTVDGFAKLDSRMFGITQPVEGLYIRSMELTQANDSVVYGESYEKLPADIRLDYNYNSVRFRYGGAVTASGKLYRTRLEPEEEDYSRWTTALSREYTSLHEGKYTFHVQIKDIQTGLEHETALTFTVLPPWYRTGYAYLAYVVMIILLLYMIYTYFEQRIVSANEHMEYEKNREIHEREKQHLIETHEWERQLHELQKEKADYELKNKSQELSSLLLNQVNRKEFADDVQQQVTLAVEELQKRRVAAAVKILKRLSEKIEQEGSEEVDWKRFEDNFDIVNDKFIRKLTAVYPWLNKNERHLCVYIRMGLYTKEIAPLFNLSVRGVEMLRYRMRKKMGLPRDANLEQYFRSFSDEQQ